VRILRKYNFVFEITVEILDSINIMTYDYASSAWGPCLADHHANFFSTSYAPSSVDRSVKAFLALKVPPSKLVIGGAAYSRAFCNTDGLGKPSSGVSPDKSWEDGVCDYKSLPRDGATEYWDDEAKAAYSYDPVKKILTSYDDHRSIEAKMQYIKEMGLGGIILWEASGDHLASNTRSLMN
jgi:chitinase